MTYAEYKQTEEYARLAPVVLRPGEKIAHPFRESLYRDINDEMRSFVDEKRVIETTGYEVTDNGNNL